MVRCLVEEPVRLRSVIPKRPMDLHVLQCEGWWVTILDDGEERILPTDASNSRSQEFVTMIAKTTDERLTTTQLDSVAEITDEELLLEYRTTGNQQLFDRLVQRYERELFQLPSPLPGKQRVG